MTDTQSDLPPCCANGCTRLVPACGQTCRWCEPPRPTHLIALREEAQLRSAVGSWWERRKARKRIKAIDLTILRWEGWRVY